MTIDEIIEARRRAFEFDRITLGYRVAWHYRYDWERSS